MPRMTAHEHAIKAIEKQIERLEGRIAQLEIQKQNAEKVLAQLRQDAARK